MAAFRLRPTGAIPAKTGSWNTGVGLRQPDMVRRELLIATSTFFTCGLLLQTGAQYSAAGNTRACVEIRSVLAEAPQVVPAFHSSNSSDCSLSDYHHIVYTVKRGRINLPKPRWITYRSYKTYKEDAFLQDMAQAPLHVCQVFDDPDDVDWAYTKMITDVIDRHAPLKMKLKVKKRHCWRKCMIVIES